MKAYIMEINDVTEELFDKLLTFINDERKEKIKKFHRREDKLRCLFAGLLLQYVICENSKLNKEDIKFSFNKFGKPYIEKQPDLFFNLSHCGSYVGAVISSDKCGIDIEKVNAIEYMDIGKSFYTNEEYNYIVSGEEQQRIHRFYEIWTLKESRIKCSGEGLSLPLKSFSINLGDINDISSNNCETGNIESYKYKLFNMNGEYKLSLCSVKGSCCDNYKELSQDYIINYYTNNKSF